MRMTNPRRWAAVAVLVPLLSLSACGGDDASPQSASGDTAAVEAAEAEVSAASKPFTQIPVSEPISGSVAGKTIVFAEPSFPVAKIIGADLEKAAEALGMNVERVNIGATPDTVATGMDEVVRAKPDAVVVVAFDPQTFWSKQAQELADAGVPTVGLGYIACDEVRDPCEVGEAGSSLALVATPEAEAFGKLQAAEIIAHSGGSAKAVYFGDPQLGNSPIIAKAFTDRMKECADCTVDSVDLSAADIGTKVPSQVVSYLQAHPDVKYVSLQFGDFAIGLPQALKAAGLGDVKITSQASSAAQFDDILADGAQIADIPVPYGYLSYVAADSIARLLVGQELTEEQVAMPLMVMGKDNLDVSDDGYWPGVQGYEDQFKALWSKTS
jgi:ribose transport system substrate-binding protein